MRYGAAIILAILLLTGSLPAAMVPPVSKPILDDIKLMDMSGGAALRQVCYNLERDTRAELVVVIIRTTRGENHHDFALRLFNQWGIGQSGIDNGLLIMFAIDDRRVEIIPGTRYKHSFDGPTSTKLLTDFVVPLMKAGKPREGVLAAANEVAKRIRAFEKQAKSVPLTGSSNYKKKSGPFSSGSGGVKTVPATSSPPSSPSKPSFLSRSGLLNPVRLIFLVFLAAWLALGILFFTTAFGSGKLLVPSGFMTALLVVTGVGMGIFAFKSLDVADNLLDQISSGVGGIGLAIFFYCGSHVCPRCNRWLNVDTRTLRSATYSSSGLGEQTQHCSSCSYHHVSTYTISRKSRSHSHSHSSSGSRSSGGRSSGGGGGASW